MGNLFISVALLVALYLRAALIHPGIHQVQNQAPLQALGCNNSKIGPQITLTHYLTLVYFIELQKY
jgi:hypothetical protein